MSFILEKDFYNKANGFPLEDIVFANISFKCNLERHDNIGIIVNSYPMYARIYPQIDGCQYGHNNSEDGEYANLDDTTRDMECPKLAWGFSAYLFGFYSVIDKGKLHSKKHTNIVISHDSDVNFDINETSTKNQYIKQLWEDYRQSHSGIKYRDVSERSKHISFLRQHIKDEKIFWKQTKPILKKYLFSSTNLEAGILLYNSVEDITKQYIKEIENRLCNIRYKWFYQTIRFVKRHILKFISGISVAVFTLIYRDVAIALYHYICKVITEWGRTLWFVGTDT